LVKLALIEISSLDHNRPDKLSKHLWNPFSVETCSLVLFILVITFPLIMLKSRVSFYEPVYLRFTGNATIFRHVLAHFSDIAARMLQDLIKGRSGERLASITDV
jgi:hypothetical protein